MRRLANNNNIFKSMRRDISENGAACVRYAARQKKFENQP